MENMEEVDVKEIRKKLKLTQEGMAQRLGVSFATLNRWENKKSKPSPMAKSMLLKLKEFLTIHERNKIKR